MEHKGYFLFSPMVEPELIFGIGLGITGIVDESMLMQKSHNPVDFFFRYFPFDQFFLDFPTAMFFFTADSGR